MGNYLTKANTTLKSQQSTIFNHKYVVGEIQGWKQHMENFYYVHTDKNCLVIGIYNGHGGKEISKYLQQKLISVLINNSNYNSQDYKQAILQTYQQINDNINNLKIRKEIIKLRHSEDHKSIERNTFFDQELEYCGSSCSVIIITKENDIYYSNLGNC